VIVQLHKRYEWYTIPIHFVRDVKHEHIIVVMIDLTRLETTPEHVFQTTFFQPHNQKQI
jgi:hypothetical protein